MTNILPFPELQFFDNNGLPLADGLVYTYIPETTTPKTTWQDPLATVANTNPVTLDSAGRGLFWGLGEYRFVVTDSLGNQIQDAVTCSALSEADVSTFILPFLNSPNSTYALNYLGVTAAIATAIDNLSLITGPTGPIGPTGPGITGPTGPTGPTGITFSSVNNVTSSRGYNTSYTNSTGGPMFVAVTGEGSLYSSCEMIVNGIGVANLVQPEYGGGAQMTIYGMVPPGATYQCNASWSLSDWIETN